MSLEVIAQEDRESIEALETVRGSHDIYRLRSELSKEGHDFGYLADALNRGVERGLYPAEERDAALEQNQDVLCMYALAMVKTGSVYQSWKPVLDKGIRSCLFSREEVFEVIMEGIRVQDVAIMEERRRNPKPRKSNVIAWVPRYIL